MLSILSIKTRENNHGRQWFGPKSIRHEMAADIDVKREAMDNLRRMERKQKSGKARGMREMERET